MYGQKNTLGKLTGTKIFYFAFGLRMVVSQIASSLLYEKYYNILNGLLDICNILILFLLISIIMIFQYYNIKEIINISILSIIFQIASFKSGQGFIILGWLFICAAKNINLKIVAKETLVISVFILLTLLGLTKIGVIEVSVMSRSDGLLRYSMGYQNPNILGYIILQIVVALTINKENNYTLFDFFILFLGFLFSYSILNCRSVAICICLLLVFMILFRDQNNKHLRQVGVITAILAPLFSIYISIIYNPQNSWLYNLDKVFSGRIVYANRYLENYGFSLVGYNMDLTILGALDNAYVRAAIFYGLVPLIIYIYGVVQLFTYRDNLGKTELICIITLMAYGMMEAHMFVINSNFTLLILSSALYKKHVIHWEKLIKSKKC